MDHITAIILAAGKGKRMNSTQVNKVALAVSGEPMIVRTLKILRDSGIHKFVVVVGFAKESILPLLSQDILVAEQQEQLGTGDAVKCALEKIDAASTDVIIVNGDDSFLYNPEVFQNLHKAQKENNAVLALVTMLSDRPTGFGRILRGERGQIVGIVEEKNATEEQRLIQEINLGCYLIDKSFLSENIDKIKKNPVSGEFYITDIVDIAAAQNKTISFCNMKSGRWQGINTPEDLLNAEKLLQHG